MTTIIVRFDTEQALENAAARLRAECATEVVTYTPKALAEDESGRGSPIPLMIFVAGIVGAAAMFGLETYSDVLNWPVNVGGRPPLSWPAFVPIAFEFGVLCAITTGFFAYVIAGRLTRLWEPVDEADAMRVAMRDGWLLAVRSNDPGEMARARRLLQALPHHGIEEIGRELEEIPA